MQVDIWSNVLLVCYIVVWIFVLFKHKARAYGYGSGMFIITTYVVYAVMSLLLFNNKYFGNNYAQLTLFPLIYLFIMLMIALRPVMRYEEKNITYIQKPSNTLIMAFIIVYGICALVSLPSSLSKIRESFASLIYSQGAGIDLSLNPRANYALTDNSVSGSSGLFNIFHNFFRDIGIFVLFYYLSLKERKKWISIYLLIVLIVDMFLSIANGGRTTFTMMLLAVGVAYFLFRDFWNDKYRKAMKWIAILLLVVLIVPVIIFTISRLTGARVSYSTLDSLTNYIGQANLNFDNHALDSNGIRYGDRTINEFKRLLGFNVPIDVNATRVAYSNMTMNDSVFSTFVGDFVLDFGAVGAAIIFVIVNGLILYFTRCRQDKIEFHKLFLIFISACVCAQGGMYLFYYSYQRNWMIIAAILMYIVFFFDYQRQLKRGTSNYLIRPDTYSDKERKNTKGMRITIGGKSIF
jgi:oligosaccharide repeat unit polymerase